MKRITMTIFLLAAFFAMFAQYQDGATWLTRPESGYEKIIISTPGSPAHCMIFTRDTKADTFIRASYASVIIKDGKLIPTILLGSFAGFEQMKTDFAIKEDGNIQTVKGKVIFPGSTVDVNETYTRVTGIKPGTGPFTGVWQILSSSAVMADGTKVSFSREGVKAFQAINPTHWMRIVCGNNNDFIESFGGTYTARGNKIFSRVDFSTQKNKKGNTGELTWEITGDKMRLTGIVKGADKLTVLTFTDILQKVPGQGTE